jgi:serine/threonine protein kinase
MNGVLHYAMEYCGGGSLADFVAHKGAVPLRQTIEIAQQISGALKWPTQPGSSTEISSRPTSC